MFGELSKHFRNTILIWILVLLAVNTLLLATVVSLTGVAALKDNSVFKSISTALVPLPPDLATEKSRADLLENLKTAYNTGDASKVLSLYGSGFQFDLRAQGFDRLYGELRKLAPSISDGGFLYYGVEDLGSGAYQFKLYYNIVTPKGVMKLVLSFVQQGNSSSAMSGIRIF